MMMLLLANAGCAQRATSLGWRFEIGRCGTVMVPMPIHHEPGMLDVTPVGTQALPKMPRSQPMSGPVQVVIPSNNKGVTSTPDQNCPD